MLPNKTYEIKDCILYESDFDVSSQIKIHRVMELMQDLATSHADKLGFGWDDMDANGFFWILSKVKIVFDKIITRKTRKFKLYTWPIAPNKFFVERRFTAVDDNGEQLFSATTIWMIVERDSRKIASQDAIARFYKADFDDTPCGVDTALARVRRNDNYSLQYERAIRRTDLDINRHVNNTNYINYAVDTLGINERIGSVEIVYHKELMCGDVISVYSERNGNEVFVVGERNGETCFTVKLTIA